MFMPSLGPGEMFVVMIVAVVIFGKNLPEVGRSLGKGIVEFKKGLRGMEDEFDSSVPSHSRASEPTPTLGLADATVPKFEPPTAAPTRTDGEDSQV